MKSDDERRKISEWPLGRVLLLLSDHNVEYLLLGGQAVVAYGASEFTRDLDLWAKPTKTNIKKLEKALDSLGANQRFLPSLDVEYLKGGHGIHFKFKYEGKDFLIDVLGKPPRVGDFNSALKDAFWIDWHGVQVPLVDIPRLVETKKTARAKDYLVIQRLAELVYEQANLEKDLRPTVAKWLLKESRTPSQLKTILKKWPDAKQHAKSLNREATYLALSNAALSEIQEALDQEQEKLQLEDKKYWKPIIAELKMIRRKQGKK